MDSSYEASFFELFGETMFKTKFQKNRTLIYAVPNKSGPPSILVSKITRGYFRLQKCLIPPEALASTNRSQSPNSELLSRAETVLL